MKSAFRALTARPAFVIVAVATLALGFGVNTAIFTFTRTVLLTPLPYPDADRLVVINEVSRARGVSYAAPIPRIISRGATGSRGSTPPQPGGS